MHLQRPKDGKVESASLDEAIEWANEAARSVMHRSDARSWFIIILANNVVALATEIKRLKVSQ